METERVDGGSMQHAGRPATLMLRVEAYGGSPILDTCKEAVQVAERVGTSVWFMFNGVDCLARAGDDPQRIADSYLRAYRA